MDITYFDAAPASSLTESDNPGALARRTCQAHLRCPTFGSTPRGAGWLAEMPAALVVPHERRVAPQDPYHGEPASGDVVEITRGQARASAIASVRATSATGKPAPAYLAR